MYSTYVAYVEQTAYVRRMGRCQNDSRFGEDTGGRRTRKKKPTNWGGIGITKMERYNSAVKIKLLYLGEWLAFAKCEESALDGGAKRTTLIATVGTR
jgi:hypothetical protein